VRPGIVRLAAVGLFFALFATFAGGLPRPPGAESRLGAEQSPPAGGAPSSGPAGAGAVPPVLAAAAPPSPEAEAEPEPEGCRFGPRFADLRDRLGADRVGDCLAAQRPAENGDLVQATSGGLLIERKADSSVAFSDGSQTWVDGPRGLLQRPNNQRFAWEAAAGGPILPRHRILAYYGNPLSTAMGILGELPQPAMLERLRQEAAAYSAAEPDLPVVPALELVTIVAQEQPGPDGMYRLRMDTELIEEVAGWAEAHGHLLILDVQPGRSAMLAEVQSLLPFLRRPYVHLALDPEFTMKPDQRPGQAIGSLDAAVVNEVVQYLGDLVEREQLPPKVLVVHRFTERMLTNSSEVKPAPNVQVVVTMDGFGPPELKRENFNLLVRDQPVQFAGFKLFYQQDKPLLSPREVIEIRPRPLLVIYQ
jgi:hypothetical protein